jgi:hypothetical protein
LLEAGADVNAIDEQGHTPLHTAVHFCSVAFVKTLLAAGADPGAVTKYGKTPREIALDTWAEVPYPCYTEIATVLEAAVPAEHLGDLREYPNQIAIDATVKLETWQSPFGGVPSQEAYVIQGYLRNDTTSPLTFEVLDGVFWASERSGGSMRVSVFKGTPETIQPGQREYFSFSTQGKSDSLVDAAGTGDILFVLALYGANKVVAGPFIALLPHRDQSLAAGRSKLEFRKGTASWPPPKQKD